LAVIEVFEQAKHELVFHAKHATCPMSLRYLSRAASQGSIIPHGAEMPTVPFSRQMRAA
jgi:hypothetical protein